MNMEVAKAEAHKFAERTNKEVVRFNPKVISRRRSR